MYLPLGSAKFPRPPLASRDRGKRRKWREWTASELKKHNDLLCSLSLEYIKKLYLLYALKDLMFSEGILPVYWHNQYHMWVKEISHQDCIHNGLIIQSSTVVPKGWNWPQESLVSTVFVSCRSAYKKKILLDRFWKFFYSAVRFLIRPNPHPVARIHESSCYQCQPAAIFSYLESMDVG